MDRPVASPPADAVAPPVGPVAPPADTAPPVDPVVAEVEELPEVLEGSLSLLPTATALLPVAVPPLVFEEAVVVLLIALVAFDCAVNCANRLVTLPLLLLLPGVGPYP